MSPTAIENTMHKGGKFRLPPQYLSQCSSRWDGIALTYTVSFCLQMQAWGESTQQSPALPQLAIDTRRHAGASCQRCEAGGIWRRVAGFRSVCVCIHSNNPPHALRACMIAWLYRTCRADDATHNGT